MSWDICIQDLPPGEAIADVPYDFVPQPLGSRDETVGRLRAAFPEADFSDPGWGVLDADGWSIEFNVGDMPECSGVMLHVRGGGADAIQAVDEAVQLLGGRALDTQTGEYFSRAAAEQSFLVWQVYRDSVLSAEKSSSSKPKGFFSRLFGR